jgi:hypothetical protein
MIRLSSALVAAATSCAIAGAASAQGPNAVAGTWRAVSATAEMNGKTSLPYGPKPQGKLVFTSDLHFVEFLHDPHIPRFKSDVRGEGTDEENRAAMAGALALYGRYTVDANGGFSGNTVEGSSFPNWIGDVRTTKELKMEVVGDRMVENFVRPGGAKVTIVWERLR